MMLDSDMCLVFKTNTPLAACLKPTAGTLTKATTACPQYLTTGTTLSALNGNCCAWVDDTVLFNSGLFTKGSNNYFCG